MKLFNAYIKKSESNALKDLVLIKSGFSFSAFFFSILWLLHNKMWKEAALLVTYFFILFSLWQSNFLDQFGFLILVLGFLGILAINAGYWYSQNLMIKGYEFIGASFGKNKDAAKLRFVENYLIKYHGSDSLLTAEILSAKERKNKHPYFAI